MFIRFIRPSVPASIIDDRTESRNEDPDVDTDDDTNNNTNDNANDDNTHNSDIDVFEQGSFRDQLAMFNPQVYTQLQYERARKEEEERHHRKEQKKRDLNEAEEELSKNGCMIVELMNKKPETCSLEEMQAAVDSSKTLVQQLKDLFN
ncbi:hypothetical protein BGZ80_003053 [Entomortierella chlamydospora]|uniref:Uncharacterized protein n=1 Tax=Entomortierella chlamydospora TaxID=101097 RepID=A0A9P6MNL3_9FUNG|nr:hypothetical protein BGZ80_003053 [Entomortierella chlamydospora]